MENPDFLQIPSGNPMHKCYNRFNHFSKENRHANPTDNQRIPQAAGPGLHR